jgi:glycosyltransferase involved in cell wall biosynthesis
VKVAIIFPRFTGLGGGERVIDALTRLYPQAEIFVLYSVPAMVPPKLRDRTIHTTFLNDIPWINRLAPKLTVLYPSAIESLDLSAYGLVISVPGPAVLGVNVPQHAVHVSYCLSPERTWWDRYGNQKQVSQRSLTRKLIYTARANYLRTWEFSAAQRVDEFASISRYISQRVYKYFRRESTVIYPPVDTCLGVKADYIENHYLSVGRLVPGKRVDLLIRACNLLGRRLLVAGTGPEEKTLKALAGPTIEFLGYVPDCDLPPLYARCRAFLFAADEDFGIVPVEAQACGRPVIAYGHGGSLETVRVGDPEGRPDTGVFFPEWTVESVVGGILRFEAWENDFIPEAAQQHAKQFDTSVFMESMGQFVDSAIRKDLGSHERDLSFVLPEYTTARGDLGSDDSVTVLRDRRRHTF